MSLDGDKYSAYCVLKSRIDLFLTGNPLQSVSQQLSSAALFSTKHEVILSPTSFPFVTVVKKKKKLPNCPNSPSSGFGILLDT